MFGEPVTVGKTVDGRMIPGVEIRNRDVIKVDTSSPAVFRRSVYLQAFVAAWTKVMNLDRYDVAKK
jgi:catalase (peroxidase I)